MSNIDEHIHEWSRLNTKELIELVERGIKPICETHEKVKTSLKYIRVPQKAKIEGMIVRWSLYIYYPQGRKLEAERAAALLRKNREFTAQEATEFGLLMGYDREKVEAWVRTIHGDDDEA